ncbi:MAG TPA: hypothetical protein VHL58_03075 [Thermoanaerobaculia bacterium]|nr:hypothetical protein [Thermoanaerobaculia bacterium]
MGLLSWIAAGIVAFGISRLLRAAPLYWAMELPLAVVAGIAGGCFATAADFGGWNELDLRAITFCLLAGLSAVAITRLIGMLVRAIRKGDVDVNGQQV